MPIEPVAPVKTPALAASRTRVLPAADMPAAARMMLSHFQIARQGQKGIEKAAFGKLEIGLDRVNLVLDTDKGTSEHPWAGQGVLAYNAHAESARRANGAFENGFTREDNALTTAVTNGAPWGGLDVMTTMAAVHAGLDAAGKDGLVLNRETLSSQVVGVRLPDLHRRGLSDRDVMVLVFDDTGVRLNLGRGVGANQETTRADYGDQIGLEKLTTRGAAALQTAREIVENSRTHVKKDIDLFMAKARVLESMKRGTTSHGDPVPFSAAQRRKALETEAPKFASWARDLSETLKAPVYAGVRPDGAGMAKISFWAKMTPQAAAAIVPGKIGNVVARVKHALTEER